MRLTSTDFSDDGRIPSVCTCEGEDLSPALQWTDAAASSAELRRPLQRSGRAERRVAALGGL